jgi:hypothetical protein
MKQCLRSESEQIAVSAFRTEVPGDSMPRSTTIRTNTYLRTSEQTVLRRAATFVDRLLDTSAAHVGSRRFDVIQ